MWASGDRILLRHLQRGSRVVSAIPQTVIADDGDTVVAWVAPGTPIVYPKGLDRERRLLPLEEWTLERRTWFGNGVVDVHRLGRAHSLRLFRDDAGAFAGWYVNLQRPTLRRALGIETVDWQLDLWIEPGGTVTWKDEDHLEQALALGLATEDEARQTREEAHRVLSEWPFPTGWESWEPPGSWTAPELPAEWATI